jgi:positive regulator of sigma E activity
MQYVMPLFYLMVGVILAFTGFLGEEAGKFKVPLGILLMGYSVFRTWRLFKTDQNTEENEASAD